MGSIKTDQEKSRQVTHKKDSLQAVGLECLLYFKCKFTPTRQQANRGKHLRSKNKARELSKTYISLKTVLIVMEGNMHQAKSSRKHIPLLEWLLVQHLSQASVYEDAGILVS